MTTPAMAPGESIVGGVLREAGRGGSRLEVSKVFVRLCQSRVVLFPYILQFTLCASAR
jgi:hypothetical protein